MGTMVAPSHDTLPRACPRGPFPARHGRAGRAPIVILHGMLGSSRNWQTVGRDLAAHRRVWALDLRNHGMSPHASGMAYSDMVGDVVAWLDRRGIARQRGDWAVQQGFTVVHPLPEVGTRPTPEDRVLAVGPLLDFRTLLREDHPGIGRNDEIAKLKHP